MGSDDPAYLKGVEVYTSWMVEILKGNFYLSRAVVTHAFNPSTQDAEVGRPL